jgi:hypothetical protein
MALSVYVFISGPPSTYSMPVDYSLCPQLVDQFSFITFECKYPGKLLLPFRMLGDCPVVVTAILHTSASSAGAGAGAVGALGSGDGDGDVAGAAAGSYFGESDALAASMGLHAASAVAASSSSAAAAPVSTSAQDGTLIDLQGPHAEWLHAFGLVPAIGDVILSIDGTVVTHLNSNQLKKFLKKKRVEIRTALAGRAFVNLDDEPVISVVFRRHYLEVNIGNTYHLSSFFLFIVLRVFFGLMVINGCCRIYFRWINSLKEERVRKKSCMPCRELG